MNSKTEYEHGKGHRKRRFCALALSSVVLCVTPTLTMSWDLSSPVNALHPSAAAFPLDANELEVYSNRGSSISQAIAEVQSTNTDLSKRGITMNRIPEGFRVEVLPNPFKNETEIRFALSGEGSVRLVVYDLLGREAVILLNEPLKRGLHSVRFSNSSLPAGTYLYRLFSENGTQSRFFTILK